MAMRGRAPSLPELIEVSEQVASMVLETMDVAVRTGSSALAPARKKATVNARRLHKTRWARV
jgi:hypothetical protein